jgi:hypothetical protein
MMGYSRDSFYRFKEFYDQGGELALQEISLQEAGVEEPRAAGDRGCHRTLAIEQPAFGRVCFANELRQHGFTVPPPAPRAIIMEHHGGLFDPSIRS